MLQVATRWLRMPGQSPAIAVLLTILISLGFASCDVSSDGYNTFRAPDPESRISLLALLRERCLNFKLKNDGTIQYASDDEKIFELIRSEAEEGGGSLVVEGSRRAEAFSKLLGEYHINYYVCETAKGSEFHYPHKDANLAPRLYAKVLADEAASPPTARGDSR